MRGKFASFLVVFAGSLLVTAAVSAQGTTGVTVTCDDGGSFSNGVEVTILQMRAGYEYTATAVGLNGFDPVLAVLGENGDGLCSDDTPGAARYAANLPTTGRVNPSTLSAQVNFTPQSDTGFQDISLVVGGFGDQSGDFVLILEGMGVTAADNGGDPLAITLTEPMISAGVPVDVYMITRGQSNVDPYVSLVDSDFNVMQFNDGTTASCDDAGTTSCPAGSVDLSNSSVTIASGTLPGWQYDAYLTLDISGMTLTKDPAENQLLFLLNSYGGSQGQYLLVIHSGV